MSVNENYWFFNKSRWKIGEECLMWNFYFEFSSVILSRKMREMAYYSHKSNMYLKYLHDCWEVAHILLSFHWMLLLMIYRVMYPIQKFGVPQVYFDRYQWTWTLTTLQINAHNTENQSRVCNTYSEIIQYIVILYSSH